jgi:hypothetical protein
VNTRSSLSVILLLAASFATANAKAQFDIEESHTTASLRGIHNVGAGVAWASGTNGTVLRTEDGGYLWQTCTIPPGAEKLDFRGIQAFDANTAIVMSSGKGDLSRLYKTTDGCQTWKLLFTNPDKDGFWDAIRFQNRNFGVLMGDPVDGKLYARYTANGGIKWQPFGNDDQLRITSPESGIFAASNSSITMPSNPNFFFAIANLNKAPVFLESSFGELPCPYSDHKTVKRCPKDYGWWAFETLPIERTGDSSGVFSIGLNSGDQDAPIAMVAVGGDYSKPNNQGGAAYETAGHDPSAEGTDARVWHASQTPPHGYRSSVAYDPNQKLWITVGPNGTDISRDDGKNWTPLKPSPQDPPDADKNWNALSLPFVVGPHGRIGRLRPITQK